MLDSIHSHRSEGLYVAAVALDASSAFDVLNHDIIIKSLDICGSGNRFLRWTESFLKDCTNFVDLDGTSSNTWTTFTGSGQGRRLSPIYYNVGTMSQAVLAKDYDFLGYADDEMNVVYANTIEECNEKIVSLVNEKLAWYKQIGIALNLAKTEIIGFGFTPDSININGHMVNPKTEITYLGVHIQSNLRWNSHIKSLCNKIRSSAARIRLEGRHFCIRDKRKLYSGWILGSIYNSGLAYLSNATQSELNDIQVAMNSGIRAIFGLPRYGHVEISALRQKLKLPSISSIKSRILSIEAWKRFSSKEQSRNGPLTRARKNRNFPLPDQKGHKGKLLNNMLVGVWNSLPTELKNQETIVSAKRRIKLLFP